MGYDRIVYIRYHFSCGLDRKDACWLSFTPLTGHNSGVNFILWASQAPDTMRMFQCIGKIAENMGEDLSGDPQQEGMVFRSFVESHFIQSLFLGTEIAN